MNLPLDLRFAFQKLPRRLPRLVVTSVFVALLCLPSLLAALFADSLFNYSQTLFNKSKTNPVYALFSNCNENTGNCLSGESFKNFVTPTLQAYDGRLDGSALVLNGLPFLPEKYLPLTNSQEVTNLLSDAALSSSSLGETLIAGTPDESLPVYGTFSRVVSPAYAAHLAGQDNFSVLSNNQVVSPSTLQEIRNTVLSVVGQTFTERYSLILPQTKTIPENDILQTEADSQPQDTESATESQAEPSDNSFLPGERDSLVVPEDSEITAQDETVSEAPEPEKSVDFYVTYRVVGIASVYNRPDLTLSRLAVPNSGESTKIRNSEASLDAEFIKGFFVLPTTETELETTPAVSELADDPEANTNVSAEPDSALSRFKIDAIRTEELPIAAFTSSADAAQYWFQESSISSNINTPFSRSVSVHVGELNSQSVTTQVVNFLLGCVIVLLALLTGFLTFLFYNSLKKSFIRRNAQTFALLHAVRATETDARLVCSPYRLLSLLLPAALVATAIYFISATFLTVCNEAILPAVATAFFWPSTPVLVLHFGLIFKIVLGIFVFNWLLSGLRTRSFSSMSHVSRYIEG